MTITITRTVAIGLSVVMMGLVQPVAGIAADVTIDSTFSDARIDIDGTSGLYQDTNAVSFSVTDGANVKYRAVSVSGGGTFYGPWENTTFTGTETWVIDDLFCDVAVITGYGDGKVDIDGNNGLYDNNSNILLPKGYDVKHRAVSTAGGGTFYGPWETSTILDDCSVQLPARGFCDVAVITGDVDGKVDIDGNNGLYDDNSTILLPKGYDVKHRAVSTAGGGTFYGPWETSTISDDCSVQLPARGFCDVAVITGYVDGKVDIDGNNGLYGDSEFILLPKGYDVKHRAVSTAGGGTFYGPWETSTILDDCSVQLPARGFCDVLIDVGTDTVIQVDGKVDIDGNNGLYDHGTSIVLPKEYVVKHRAVSNAGGGTFYGPWKETKIANNCGKTLPQSGFCLVPIVTGFPDGKVDIDGNNGLYDDGSAVVMPKGYSVKHRAVSTAGGGTFYGPWENETIAGNCSDTLPKRGFVEITLCFVFGSHGDPGTDIDGNNGLYAHNDKIVMPLKYELKCRPKIGGWYGPWFTKSTHLFTKLTWDVVGTTQ